MCGIAGFIASKNIALPILISVEALKKQLERGTQGAGVMFLNDDKAHIAKAPIHPVEFLNSIRQTHQHIISNISIAHNRAPTSEVTLENTHPFRNALGMTLVHNGVVRDERLVRSILEACGFEFEGTCDTETLIHLAQLIYERTSDELNFYQQYANVVHALDPGVVVLLIPQHNAVMIIRTHNPLYACWTKDKKIFIFASTKKTVQYIRARISRYFVNPEWKEIKFLQQGYVTIKYNNDKLMFDETMFREPVEVVRAHKTCPYKSKKKARKKCPYKDYRKCPYIDRRGICPFTTTRTTTHNTTPQAYTYSYSYDVEPMGCTRNPKTCPLYSRFLRKCLWNDAPCPYDRKRGEKE